MNRRTLLIGVPAAALSVAAGGTFAYWHRGSLPDEVGELTVQEAQARLAADEIWLVDIRRPDEWQATGVASGALLLDMRREDFIDALAQATSADPGRPMAFICARGVRSRRLIRTLDDAGIGPIIDVPEGMLGSPAGPGWIAAGLPVVQPPDASQG
ncbi:MAG: rhodanese-like domain-containing protein [Pseudomonadota bacterium]